MKISEKYINQWSETINEARKMLESKDFGRYNDLMTEANAISEKIKKDDDLTYKCSNFGLANHIFEEALPKLFKSNKRAVKEVISTIKEDRNLLTQFSLMQALRNYNNNLNINDYVNESFELASKNIDRKSLNESNRKFAKLIEKYEVKPSNAISDDVIKFYESCDYVLKNKKSLKNLNEHNINLKSITDYTEKNFNTIIENKTNVLDVVESFDRKYSKLLNEDEKSFVQEIMDFKAPQNEQKKEKLFNKFKNECIVTVDKLISEASDDEKDELNAIKEQIIGKEFCVETIVSDLAKLLEIRDILMSE